MNRQSEYNQKWQKNNPEKLRAEKLANRYPWLCEIEWTCPHPGRKIKHHPDFKQPFLIQMLCRKCHCATYQNSEKANHANQRKQVQ